MVKILYEEKLYSSVTFLYYYAKIIGLCPLNLNGKLKLQTSSLYRLYAIFLSISYIFLFIWSIRLKYTIIFSHKQIIEATDLVDIFVHISQLIATIFIWLTFAFRQKRLKNIVKSLQTTMKFCQQLKISSSSLKIMGIIQIWSYFVFFYFTTVFIVDQTFHCKIFSLYNLILWGLYRYPHIVIHHVYFLFISVLQIIELKFLHLNKILKKCGEEEMFNCAIFGYRFSSLTVKKITIAKQLHSYLIKIVEDVEDFFSVPILLMLMVNFVNTVSSVNIIYHIVIKNAEWYWMLYLSSTMHFLVLFSNIVELFFISTASGSISNEANNTGIALCKLWTNSKSNRMYSK
ncbi:uncharacterized protein LOC122508221 [Leptopilina heterotoma]|uniref:uncharacterized protein LOC122508221 n=1 Tax=Leptopilina heterotoma TaxID=63436 RepID=UPI001CA7BD6E|nr:uncharacterized protein LOC122508221 [Leptopilina heterotoma]